MASTTLQFYRDRADEARRDGEAATLDHVRERCRRSEQAWTVLGDRLAATEANKLARENEKAASPQE